MGHSSNAAIALTGYSWVPAAPRGLVRDVRVRWMLEELGLDYRTILYDRRTSGPADRLAEQPFGQVPALHADDVHMFESGAICLWLAERSEAMLPREEAARAQTLSWVFAALNSVEPVIFSVQCTRLFFKDQPGAAEFAPTVEAFLRSRLGQLADALGERDWLAGDFTVADLIMVTVLRQLARGPMLAEHPALLAYVARGEARPAFGRALAAHMADFSEPA